MKGFKQLEVKTRSTPMSEIIRGKLKPSTVKCEGSNMILAATQRITKQKTKVKNDHRSKFSNLSNWKEEA